MRNVLESAAGLTNKLADTWEYVVTEKRQKYYLKLIQTFLDTGETQEHNFNYWDMSAVTEIKSSYEAYTKDNPHVGWNDRKSYFTVEVTTKLEVYDE